MVLTDQFKRNHLKEWRRTTDFYCPHCSSSVHMKVGEIVIPHFAHRSNATCTTTFSEGESSQHLLGKRHLYSLLKRNVDTVELEPYLHELAQRPDLLVIHRSHCIPIEFQCSTIPVALVHSRTEGYKTAGMQPIWILSTPPLLKALPEAVGIIHLSRFHESLLLPSSPEGPTLLTFDPHNERFHYFSNLLHIAGKRYIGIHRTLPSSLQTFPFALPKSPSETEMMRYFHIYSSKRNSFLKSRILMNKRGINDPFLRACYELKIHPEKLPNWIGIPVLSNHAFQEHDCEWQMQLLRFMQFNGFQFHNLTNDRIRNFISTLPEATALKVQATMEYRQFLTTLNKRGFTMKSVIEPNEIVKLIAARFLAK